MQLIFKLILLFVGFQLVRSMLRRSMRARTSEKDRVRSNPSDEVDYSGLSPYEIEDADYEELPGDKE